MQEFANTSPQMAHLRHYFNPSESLITI